MLFLQHSVRRLFDGNAKWFLASRLNTNARECGKHVSRVREKPKGGKRGIVRRDTQIKVSQTIAFLLRHGGVASGLPMRKDGYVAVDDLVSSASWCLVPDTG
jgi:RNA:NAD 2'-phosphotransferase (TPT1/KptA family)